MSGRRCLIVNGAVNVPASVSENDRREIDKFADFIRRVGEAKRAGVPHDEAVQSVHADCYPAAEPGARILVDQLIRWPNAPPPFDKGSCHLTIEGDDLEPLHAFAKRLGMKRSWFQPHSKMPHYDLTPGRREAALRFGAVFVEAREQARARRARKAAQEAASAPVKP